MFIERILQNCFFHSVFVNYRNIAMSSTTKKNLTYLAIISVTVLMAFAYYTADNTPLWKPAF